jgi:hypothetical protein
MLFIIALKSTIILIVAYFHNIGRLRNKIQLPQVRSSRVILLILWLAKNMKSIYLHFSHCQYPGLAFNLSCRKSMFVFDVSCRKKGLVALQTFNR